MTLKYEFKWEKKKQEEKKFIQFLLIFSFKVRSEWYASVVQ